MLCFSIFGVAVQLVIFPARHWVELSLHALISRVVFQVLELRHGVMMVGPSGSGKTSAWRCLLSALEMLDGVKGEAHVIDPKAIGVSPFLKCEVFFLSHSVLMSRRDVFIKSVYLFFLSRDSDLLAMCPWDGHVVLLTPVTRCGCGGIINPPFLSSKRPCARDIDADRQQGFVRQLGPDHARVDRRHFHQGPSRGKRQADVHCVQCRGYFLSVVS